MYCTFYGFREKPFNITPNPRFLYLSKNHKEAFAHLLYGINSHAGFIALTGEVGTGKTTVLRTILEQLDDDRHRTALILNPCLSALELHRHINREFGIPHDGLEIGALLEELNRFLLQENRAGKTIVLVIDEAQNLAPAVLEQIRLISNLETESDKLIQILLAGQPELNTLLARAELRQLAQRITVRYHLQPLDFEDSSNYIRHRLQVAGGGAWIRFTAAAVKRIYAFAKGSPRLLNIACDRALLIGYTEDTGEISAQIAAKAVKELQSHGERRRLSPQALAIASALLLTIAVLFGLFRLGTRASLPPPAAAPVAAAQAEIAADIPVAVWKALPASPYPALNLLFRIWGTPPATPGGQERTIAAIAASNGFSSLPVLSLDNLIQLDTPAVIEIRRRPGEKARLVAITAADRDTVTLSPVNGGAQTVSREKLAAVWTGRGRIIWQNRLGLADRLDANAPAEEIRRLQAALRQRKELRVDTTGTFDRATVSALQQVQREAGLTPDGMVDQRTLLLLNRTFASPPTPRLQPTTGKRP